jgi:oligopeptide/dipeptide ABC transporter ATP-binding protein
VVQGETPSAVDRPRGCHFHTRCPAAQPMCAERSPEAEPVTDAHQVACLRWREITGQSGSKIS